MRSEGSGALNLEVPQILKGYYSVVYILSQIA